MENYFEPDRQQMTILCKRITCWIIEARIQTHTQNVIRLLFCFSTAKVVWRTRINIKFLCTLSVVFVFSLGCPLFVCRHVCPSFGWFMARFQGNNERIRMHVLYSLFSLGVVLILFRV